jgi:hypothetical protein
MLLRRIAFAGAALAALAAGAAAQTATAPTRTRQFSYPPVGLAASETAQVNVVNVAGASSNGTAASCTGTITFLNSSGATIGTATPFTVTSGQIFSAPLPFNKVGASGTRTEIRGVVALTVTPGSGVPCALTSSLETYDTGSGATHVFFANGVEMLGGGYGR